MLKHYKKYADYFLTIGAFALAFIYSLRRMSDTDLWAHLKCGEYFFSHGAVLKTYYFNCSWPDFPYLNHEWLFQAIIYKVYYYSGETGLVSLQVALVIFSFFVLYRILRLYTGSPALISFILSLGIIASSHRFALRPQHFSYIFLLYILFSLHMYQRGKKTYAWFMPLIMAAWVNIHAESLWGIMVPGVFLVVEFVKMHRGRGMDKKDLSTLVIISCLVLAASMLNPFGYKTVFWPFFVMKEQFAGVEEILSPVAGRYIFFWIYFLVFVVSTVFNLRRIDPTWLVLSLIFAAVAWTANRGIPHFVFLSAPLVALNLETLSGKFHPGGRLRRFFPAFARALLAAFICWMVFSVTTSPLYLKKYDNVPYPEGALRFMMKNNVKGNVLNHHPWGGYIIWNSYPLLRPYIDGRFFHRKFYDEFNYILSVGAGWQDILARYHISIVLMPYSDTDKGTLNDRLFFVPAWHLVYWDDVSLLYMKDDEENMRVIEAFGNSIINPDRQLYEYQEKSPRLVEKANEAAEKNLASAPSSHKALLLSANTFFLKGDFRTAVKRYEGALARPGNDSAWVFYRAALCYRYIGNLNKSADYAGKCLALAPDFQDAAKLLGELSLLERLR